MRLLLALAAPLLARAELPDVVVKCEDYVKLNNAACKTGGGAGCVTQTGWYSKVNTEDPKRVNAQQICKDEGYAGASQNYGGNWGKQCRHPGNQFGTHNKAGGTVTSLGYTVSWQCSGDVEDLPTKSPATIEQTASPTQADVLPFNVGESPVVDCGKYNVHFQNNVSGKECHNKGSGCVSEGWFSKDNTQGGNWQRVNAVNICKQNGFTGADANSFGGNWGDICRFPGNGDTPNKAGGALTQLGFTVTWKCTGSRGSSTPVISPTPEPTKGAAHDTGYPLLPEHVIDCGNYEQTVDKDEERECVGTGRNCVGDHWYSKDSLNHRVNADKICKDQGYKGIDRDHYGGNWGHKCRYPGSMEGEAEYDDEGKPTNDANPNKAGGDVTALGFTVTWKCELPRAPPSDTALPTSVPTSKPDDACDEIPEEMNLPTNVVYCGGGHYADETDPECEGEGEGCVGEHWFSKDNTQQPNQRVDANQVCKDNGFAGIDTEMFGGNWGHKCRFPGTNGKPNKAGGAVNALGYTVSWKCKCGDEPTAQPTSAPGTVIDCGEYAKLGDARECGKQDTGTCVGKGWFSKDNKTNPDQRVNAVQICQQNGYTGASNVNYGGNWGHKCRFPGNNGNPNKAGGFLTNFGFTVTWQCVDGTPPPSKPATKLPTAAPTVQPDLDELIEKGIVKVCEDYSQNDDAECDGMGVGCVGEGWYSKDNTVNPYQRLDAEAICKLEGYETVGEYGGNWGHLCRYPGTAKGNPNKGGGNIKALGYTVSWQCINGVEPTPAPTEEPDQCAGRKKKACLDGCEWTGEECITPQPNKCDAVDKMTEGLHKTICKNLKDDEAECKATSCKFKSKEKKGKVKTSCKANKEKKIKCKNIGEDACCTFPGCEIDGKGNCGGEFAGW